MSTTPLAKVGLSFKQSIIFMVLAALVIGGVAVAVPPTQAKMYDILTRGLSADPVRKTTTVGTTPDDLIDTDLTTTPYNQKTDAYTQLVVVTNKDTAATDNLCVGDEAWSGVTTCGALCAASTMTCSGTSTDGSLVLPGTQRSFRYTGEKCLCIVATTAATPFQAEREVR